MGHRASKDRSEAICELQLHLMAWIIRKVKTVRRDVWNLRGPGNLGGETLGKFYIELRTSEHRMRVEVPIAGKIFMANLGAEENV
jgi:hypothetical protein